MELNETAGQRQPFDPNRISRERQFDPNKKLTPLTKAKPHPRVANRASLEERQLLGSRRIHIIRSAIESLSATRHEQKFWELRRKIRIGSAGHKDGMARTALAPKPPSPGQAVLLPPALAPVPNTMSRTAAALGHLGMSASISRMACASPADRHDGVTTESCAIISLRF